MGDKVIIPKVPTITISDYKKGQMLTLQFPEEASTEFSVNRGKSYNFAIDDVDVKQMKIKDWISKYAVDAAEQMRIKIETEVLSSIYVETAAANKGLTAGKKSQFINLGTIASPLALTNANILRNGILNAALILDEQDRPDSGRWMIAPPWFIAMLKDSDIRRVDVTGDQKSPLRNGLVGMIDRFELYSSNLVFKEAAANKWHILFGHKSSLTYVSNFVKTEMYRPEQGFMNAMKGLTVYDFKVLHPESLGELVVSQT
jgi:hypothetical protein